MPKLHCVELYSLGLKFHWTNKLFTERVFKLVSLLFKFSQSRKLGVTPVTPKVGTLSTF